MKQSGIQQYDKRLEKIEKQSSLSLILKTKQELKQAPIQEAIKKNSASAHIGKCIRNKTTFQIVEKQTALKKKKHILSNKTCFINR